MLTVKILFNEKPKLLINNTITNQASKSVYVTYKLTTYQIIFGKTHYI